PRGRSCADRRSVSLVTLPKLLVATLIWTALPSLVWGQSFYLPQPVAGAQRGVVKYHEGLFGHVHYKSRYGHGIRDNGGAVFVQLCDAAKTLVPVILDATSPIPGVGTGGGGAGGGGGGGSAGGAGSGIPKTSGGEGRSAELRAAGISESSLDDDLRAVAEMQSLVNRLEE